MTSVHSEASLLSYKSFSEAGGGFRDGTMGGGGGEGGATPRRKKFHKHHLCSKDIANRSYQNFSHTQIQSGCLNQTFI